MTLLSGDQERPLVTVTPVSLVVSATSGVIQYNSPASATGPVVGPVRVTIDPETN